MARCEWCGSDPLYVAYHDEEWGVPEYDDRALFEKLILDGAQAGLSWLTILKKRDNYRTAFDHFHLETIASYGPEKIEALMQDVGIVRNRLKIESTVKNAKACLQIIEEHGSLSDYLWSFVGGTPIVNQWRSMKEIPVTSDEAKAMSKALKKLGCNFVGPTIIYAYMQAVGMVNDHIITCPRYTACQALSRS